MLMFLVKLTVKIILDVTFPNLANALIPSDRWGTNDAKKSPKSRRQKRKNGPKSSLTC